FMLAFEAQNTDLEMQPMAELRVFLKTIFLLLIVLVTLSETISTGDDADVQVGVITPTHYNIDLILDPRSSTYEGVVEIMFNTTNNVMNIIQLHASSETINVTSAISNFEDACNITGYTKEYEFLTIICPLGPDENKDDSLVVRFQGKYTTDNKKGLYKGTYTEGGQEYVLLASQSTNSAARGAFPCFDQPEMKATFDVYITHPGDYRVLGNTVVKKQYAVGSNQIQTQLETTPEMSTYLLSFIVSKLA
ncbi:hypothetical protein NQ315_003111, partial [Exocentrus adspersus]